MREIEHFGLIKNGIIEKRLEYTTLNEKGYSSKYYISNDGNLEILYRHTYRYFNRCHCWK